MKIVFTGGGSGGHIYPIISIARELKKIIPGKSLDIFFVGSGNRKYKEILKKEEFIVRFVISGKIRRYFGIIPFIQNIFDIVFKIPFGFIQSFLNLFFIAPDLVFSKGGYGAVGAVFSAKILGIPVFFHESDISPGLANRKSTNSVLEIFTSFRNTEFFPKDKQILVGNPITTELCTGNKEEGKNLFDIKSNNPVVLILGGSQGSVRINNLITEISSELLESFELIHQCGDKNFEDVKKESLAILSKEQRERYHIYPYLEENYLKNAYSLADIIVSRAGAGLIFQIAACGKPSIIIPLPESAQNHQVKNAYAYAENGSCLVIEEGNLNPHYFLKILKDLNNDKEWMKRMSESALSFAKPKAAKIIAEYIKDYLLK